MDENPEKQATAGSNDLRAFSDSHRQRSLLGGTTGFTDNTGDNYKFLMNLNEEMPSFFPGLGKAAGANTISNHDDDSEEELKEEEINTGPKIRSFSNRFEPTKKVFTNDLRQFIKSKEDLYCILGVEGQFHLPPFDECTMEFLRDALCGKKKLLSNTEVRSVCVPRYKEFNAGALYQSVMQDGDLRAYLPEPSSAKSKPVNKKFLFNIISTLRPEYFQTEIQKALHERKEKDALANGRFVEMQQSMLDLITGSQHVSRATRGKALSFLNVNSKKRKRHHAGMEEQNDLNSTRTTSGFQMGANAQQQPFQFDSKRRYAFGPGHYQ